MKPRLLIFAHYYAPDVASTGQILKDQAEGMLSAFDVTVICTVPSYGGYVDAQYKDKRYYYEQLNGVDIIRVRVPEFIKSSKFSRAKNILVYFFGALHAARKAGPQDYIFTISQPPILGGLLGVLAKWQKRAPMIYCIQDFNPEQVIAVQYSKSRLILKAMMAADKFSCRQADLVVTVGRDLVETLEKRFHYQDVPKHIMINNWIDEKEVYPLPADNEHVQTFRKWYGLENRFVIMYSGNIGMYYDLENLLKVLEQFPEGTRSVDGRKVAFVFVGNGTARNGLFRYKEEHHMDNVFFIPYQDKENLIYSLNAADIHLCVNAKGIKGVSCPSKAYGIMAAGRPILGCLENGTEVLALIEECACGYCCEPGDYDGFATNIRRVLETSNEQLQEMGMKGRRYLEQNLTKDASVKKYIAAILSIKK